MQGGGGNMGEGIRKTVSTSEVKSQCTLFERVEQESDASSGGPQMAISNRSGCMAGKRLQINRERLVKLIEEQEYRCKLSGIELTPDIASLDHIVPVSKGGEHVVGNVAWVHSEINRMKGQLSVDEFVSLCSKVVQYNR